MNLTRKTIAVFILAHTLIFAAGMTYTHKRDKTRLRKLYASKAQSSSQLIGANISTLNCQGKGLQAKELLDGLRKEQSIEFARLTMGQDTVTSVDPSFPLKLSLLDTFDHMDVFEENQIFLTFSEVPGCGKEDSAGEIVIGYSFRELNKVLKNQLLSQINLFGLQLLTMIGLILALSRIFKRFAGRINDRCRAIAKGDLKEVQLFDRSNELFLVGESLNSLCNSLVQAKKDAEREKVHLISKTKYTALEEMAASISRQVDNPVRLIQGKAGQMKRILSFPDLDRNVISRQADVILEQSQKLIKISEKLKEFSTSARIHFQSVRIQSILSEVLLLAEARCVSMKAVIQLQMGDPSLRMECRPQEVIQILNTLVENALDSVLSQDEKWIKLEVQENAGYVEIAVIDNGPSIPADVREKMMQPFFSTKRKNKVQGIGVGLSHALLLARQHNGSLHFEDSPSNKRFILRLPLMQSNIWENPHQSTHQIKTKNSA